MVQLPDPQTKPTEDWYKAFLVKSFSHGINLLESCVITRQPPVQAKRNNLSTKPLTVNNPSHQAASQPEMQY